MSTTQAKSLERDTTGKSQYALWLAGGVVVVLALMAWSITVGTAQMSVADIVFGNASLADQSSNGFAHSAHAGDRAVWRGNGSGWAGHELGANRYVEPSTTGAQNGRNSVLIITLVFPGASILAKMGFPLVSPCRHVILLTLIRSILHRDIIVVPLLEYYSRSYRRRDLPSLAVPTAGHAAAWLSSDFSAF